LRFDDRRDYPDRWICLECGLDWTITFDLQHKKFWRCIPRNKLYLKSSLCKQIERAFKDTKMPSYNYIFALGAFVSSNIDEEQHNKEWEKKHFQIMFQNYWRAWGINSEHCCARKSIANRVAEGL
ncbi:MAG: hypothetical protein V7629_21355, partial [Motiliproteus sp.]